VVLESSSPPPAQEKGGEAGAGSSDLPVGWMLQSSAGRKFPWQHQLATHPSPSGLGHFSGLESPSQHRPLPLRPNLVCVCGGGHGGQQTSTTDSSAPLLDREEMEVAV
jgi:hypothetical protein